MTFMDQLIKGGSDQIQVTFALRRPALPILPIFSILSRSRQASSASPPMVPAARRKSGAIRLTMAAGSKGLKFSAHSHQTKERNGPAKMAKIN
jgi:hypothetical protein